MKCPSSPLGKGQVRAHDSSRITFLSQKRKSEKRCLLKEKGGQKSWAAADSCSLYKVVGKEKYRGTNLKPYSKLPFPQAAAAAAAKVVMAGKAAQDGILLLPGCSGGGPRSIF